MTPPSAPPTARTAGPAVEVRGLRRRYGALTALDGVDLTVPAGSLTALIGPNGSGKTTTMRVLLGLDRPDAGTGTVLGHPLDRPERYLHAVGALIEQPALYRRLDARTNLRVLAELGGIPRGRVDEVLEQVGLTAHAGRPVSGYSLGMRQRLGIAAALLPEPRLLVLDEPMNGLDPIGILQLRELLRSLADSGATVLVSSHQLNELDAICDRFILMHRGRVLFQGGRAELTASRTAVVELAPESAADGAALHDVLSGAGYPNRHEDGLLLVEAPADAAAELNRIAAAGGVTLAHLAVRRTSVEQAFLALVTGTGPAPTAPTAPTSPTERTAVPC
ncbi:ABC transporter ATP-binding protein [Kitasatospora sp. NPDC056273]|uniref:ABC transporter ATP-binding protein n=1 Tax=Kitasatospora sp. NPDC056273 TaxID=3345769 RepID=UPI0035DD7AB1